MHLFSATCVQGLSEMRRFSKELYPTVRDETFFESCGVADLIATCYGGRNRLVAMEYTRQIMVSMCVCV
jgi:glycerol-3-phosphate dehydrogenase (NAD+)